MFNVTFFQAASRLGNLTKRSSLYAASLTLLTATSCSSISNPRIEPDNFLWLEEISSERALDWVKQENTRSKNQLESLKVFPDMLAEAETILTSTDRIPYGKIRGKHVFNFWQDSNNVRGILRRASLDSYQSEPVWETLLDIDSLSELENKNWVYDGYTCLPPAYDRCMIGLSPGGTDAAVYREYSMLEKRFIDNGFYLPAAKSSLDWIDSDTLLVGTDWGDGTTDSGYAHTVKILKRGESLAQATPVYQGEKTDVGLFATVLRDGETSYPVTIRAVGFFETEYHWQQTSGTVKKLALPTKSDVLGIRDNQIYVLLKEQWINNSSTFPQGSLIKVDLDDSEIELVFVPEDNQAIVDVALGESAVFVNILDDVQGRLIKLERLEQSWKRTPINLPQNGTINIESTSADSDQLMVGFESLTVPNSLYFLDNDESVNVIKSLPALYDANQIVVEQRFVDSSDGARIPYFVMARREVLEQGNAPTIQYGYGGFEIPILPTYYTDVARPQHGALAGKLWISRGGVLVLSNIRGGGEYGPAWHAAALQHNRQLAFDDFFAISARLIADGVTTPQKLGAIGRSNGGLLMGVALTQRPDLYSAIDCGVPLADMLRYHKLLAGASWVGEYGNPDIPADRAILEKYSPYQNIRSDVDYPNIFFYTSTKDDRVHPGHARKMAAKLQEYGQPFLYYENIEGGHGGAANQDQLAYRTALEFAYFYQQLVGE